MNQALTSGEIGKKGQIMANKYQEVHAQMRKWLSRNLDQISPEVRAAAVLVRANLWHCTHNDEVTEGMKMSLAFHTDELEKALAHRSGIMGATPLKRQDIGPHGTAAR